MRGRSRYGSRSSPSMFAGRRSIRTAPYASHLGAVELRRRRRTPDARVTGRPELGPLRRVMMPRPRLEVAELLVLHLVELTEKLDHLLVRIAVIGRDIVAGTMAQRSPDDGNPPLPHHLA